MTKKHDLGCLANILKRVLYGRIHAIVSDVYEEKGKPRFMVMAEYQGDVTPCCLCFARWWQHYPMDFISICKRIRREACYAEAANFLGYMKD